MLDWLADTFLMRAVRLRYDEIQARRPLYCLGYPFGNSTGFRLRVIGARGDAARWNGCYVSVEQDGLHVYPRTRHMDIHVHFPPTSLRWFGRREKYVPGRNEIWLHFASGSQWHVLMIRAERYEMQGFVRALKQIATPEQVKAYRRQRPYIHYGPAPAWPAKQDIYGAWTVDANPLSAYLMPYALVLMVGDEVRRVLPLEHVQQVEVMRRLDAPDAGGVVRFDYTGEPDTETLAFALPDYLPFGASLVEAAKRTLEDPPMFYGKKKDEDDEDE